MRDVHVKPIESSELSLGQLDAVSGGETALTETVRQMMLISTILKDLADTQKAIIGNLR
jgi:hypothetical protein